eukprot:TRINITY_DN23114_c0_g1_i1.p1 TRINITY_DN23114_c0_g1~~TRINITY_DN23114_c0_g1_i1.p1  ORF type:complete len:214 (+),score=14.00 TRINITY_DN23114_c0_g1_i1:33-674(+)
MSVTLWVWFLAVTFAFGEKENQFKRYIFTGHRKNVAGIETSRPLFAGLTLTDYGTVGAPVFTSLATDPWVCWRVPVYDLMKRKVGDSETCLNENAETFHDSVYDMLVTTLKIKKKGTLVIYWIGESSFDDLGSIYADSTNTQPTLWANSPAVPGIVLNDLSTGVFRHLKGTCQANALIDYVLYANGMGWSTPIHFNRMYWDCRFEETDDGDNF